MSTTASTGPDPITPARDAERLDREEGELEKIKTALRAVHANLCYRNELE